MSHARLEKHEEQDAMKFARKRGWEEYKFVSTVKGVPDRILSRPKVGPIFIEWKKRGEKLSPNQVIRHEEMRKAGMRVVTFNDSVEFGNFVEKTEFLADRQAELSAYIESVERETHSAFAPK